MHVERIVIDPQILNGKPSIRGTRISVQTIMEFLGSGDSIDEVLKSYPSLTREDILACLRFTASLMEHNFVIQPVGV